MVKKHILGIALVFFVTVGGTALILSFRPARQSVQPAPQFTYVQAATAAVDEPVVQLPMNFATEAVPVSDSRIAWRMNNALNKHSFERLHTSILHQKAERWFPVIEPILAEYGIPQDFKYIALVESGLREGTSYRGASGFWQFMPATARSYGLKVNSSVDERQNMHKSTVAACKYLRALYSELRNWTLTAAAYNLGDVKLKKQMLSQNKRNYYKLKLNRETSQYVYKLVSMKAIIENPSKYGYKERKKLLASLEEKSSLPMHGGSGNPVIALSALQN